jgi:uncharacterized protein (TIGR03437 family)
MVVPVNTAAAGQEMVVYFTGAGAVAPAVTTGAGPGLGANPPAPVGAVTVTVGGVNAQVAFVGLTADTAGVAQVNFYVPAGVAGKQPVVVAVGGVQSAAAYLTVTN